MTADHPSLDIEFSGPAHATVAWLWLNRPAQHNSIDRTLMQNLTKTIASLDKNPSVRVIIVAGRGNAFSHGIDLDWLQQQSIAPLNEALNDSKRLAHMLNMLSECATPTIARVHGVANGIGAGLAAACHICIAASEASFSINDAQLGLIPTVIGPHLIRAIGERQCYRYFQTAERMSAMRAYEMGLAHEMTEREHLDIRLHEIVASLLQCDPIAQGAATKLVRRICSTQANDDVFSESLRQGAKLRGGASPRDRLRLLQEKNFAAPFHAVSRAYPLLDAE